MLPSRNNLHLPAGRPVFFDDFTIRDNWKAAQRALPLQLTPVPATNVFETPDIFVIELAIPGVTHEDIQFFTTDRSIELRYEPDTGSFEAFGARRIWHAEYRPVPFRRQFELNPEALDLDRLQVSSAHGIIRMEIPKKGPNAGRIVPAFPFSLN